MKALKYFAAAILIAGLVAACGDPTKEDIVKRSEGIDSKQQLEKVLGRPDDIAKVGPIETWTYNAANGAVSFVIAGDRVTISTTSNEKAAP